MKFTGALLCLLSSLSFYVAPAAAQNVSGSAGGSAQFTYVPGTYYSFRLTIHAAYNYVASFGGSHPPGLNENYNNSGCAGTSVCVDFSGTVSGGASGNYNFTVNSGPYGTFTLNFVQGVAPLDITTTSLSSEPTGSPVTKTLVATGGTTPYTWSVSSGALPDGTSLSSSSGQITGTPTRAGSPTFTVQVTDANSNTDTQSLTWTIYAAGSISNWPADFTVGHAASLGLTATGGTGSPYSFFSGSSLPAGLSVSNSGTLSGTPTTVGTGTASVEFYDSGFNDFTIPLAWEVHAAPVVTTTSLPAAEAGVAYSQQLQSTGGFAPLSWAVTTGSLPTGLSLSSGGLLSGTPTGSSASVTVTLTDANGATDTQNLSLTVNSGPEILTTSLPAITVGQSVSETLSASGGSPGYSWTLASGSLPPGIGISSGGVLSGTPTVAGSYPFTLEIEDNCSEVDTQALTWLVNAAPSVTTSSLPATTVGASYSQTVAASGGTGSLGFSVSAGSLPGGLNLNGSSGAITGTPTTAETASFTIQVTDANSVNAPQALSIVVNPAPSVTTTSLPSGSVGAAYSQTLAYTGGTGGASWQVSAGSLPAGLSLSTAGVISGTPSAEETTNFTVRMTDAASVSDTQALSIQIYDLPEIQTTSLSEITVGQSVSESLSATGGSTPYGWTLSSGALPNGISLNGGVSIGGGGSLSGTPTTAGTFNFTLQVTDSNSQTDSQALAWVVNAAPEITTTSLPATSVSAAYSQTVGATGGTGSLTFSISAGALPAGLNINSSTGAITGTPTTAGTANFTVQAADSRSIVDTQALSILVNAAPQVTTLSTPNGTVGRPYSQNFSATGGTGAFTWQVASGALPQGFSLSTSGVLTSAGPVAAGTFNFTVSAEDEAGAVDTQALSLEIVDAPSITTTGLPEITVGQTVSESLSHTGGQSPFGWAVTAGALPAGISLGGGGALSGTPTTAGTANFTVQVNDVNGAADTQALSWVVNAAPEITTTSLPATSVDASYSQTVGATGGTGSLTFSISAGALPAGLNINSSTGAITGTPTTAGTANFTVQASDARSVTDTQALSILVNAAPQVTTLSTPNATVGRPYSQSFSATGGTGAYTWQVTAGALPQGFSFSTAGALTSASAVASGAFHFTVGVTDEAGVLKTQALTLEIVDAPVITTTSLPEVTVGQSVSESLNHTGGQPLFGWSVVAGALPDGIELDGGVAISVGGALSGTPTTAGAASFTVQIIDDNGAVDEQALTWIVNAAPEITTTSLPATSVDATFSQTVSATGGTGSLTFTVSAGALPAGLNLNGSTGAITGTPTTQGTANFTVEVSDSRGITDTQALSITVNRAPEVTTLSTPNATVGRPYLETLSATGGTGAYTWQVTAGALPEGFSLSTTGALSSEGAIASGTFHFTVGVTDEAGVLKTQALTLEIVDAPVVTTTSLPDITVGQNVSELLEHTGGQSPFGWSVTVGALPAGIELDGGVSVGVGGTLSGTPTTAGTASFTVQINDVNGAVDEQALTWTVEAAPSITTSAVPETTTGRPTPETTLQLSGGVAPVTWTATGLPAGVSLSTSGVLSGTPIAPGATAFSVKATDANGIEATRDYTFTSNVEPEITVASLPRGTVGAAYSHTLQSTGGTGQGTWTATPALPPGMALSPAGLLSGTPTERGTTNFTLVFTDDAGARVEKPITFEAVEELVISTLALPAITVGQQVSVTPTSTGGAAPVVWSIATGSLPSGVTLNPETGKLSGVLTGESGGTFTLRATDADQRVADQSYVWTVNPEPVITTEMLPTATAKAEYRVTYAATGGTSPLAWSGVDLPAGLTVDLETGVLSGQPNQPGSKTVTVKVTDANGLEATTTIAIEIAPEIEIATDSIDPLERGEYVTFKLDVDGGMAPFTWSGNGVAGLRVRSDGTVFGSPTGAGTFTLSVRVTDANGARASRSFEVLIEEDPGFRVSPSSLRFEVTEEGPAVAPQQVAVTSTPANQPFGVSADRDWLEVSFDRSETPAVLTVRALPEGLAPGEYAGVVTLIDTDQTVAVALSVLPAPEPTLDVDPDRLRLTMNGAAQPERRLFGVETMGEPGVVEASVRPGADWLGVELRRAEGRDDVATIAAVVDPQGLGEGEYEGVIEVLAGELSVEVPVSLRVAETDFELSHSGFTFDAVVDRSSPLPQPLRVLNRGALPLDWQATEDAPWLSTNPTAGTASPTSEIDVEVDVAGLDAGFYEGEVVVASQDGTVDRSAAVRLQVDPASTPPQSSPSGLSFVSIDGAAPAAQFVALANPSPDSVSFAQAVSPASAADWLSVTPAAGSIAPDGSSSLTVQPQPAGLAPGMYDAAVTIEFSDGTVRVVQVSLIVRGTDCEPNGLVAVTTRLGDHFQARADWPWPIEVRVTDDCGNPALDGFGLVRFSSAEEPALALMPGPDGLWTATWTPQAAHESITVTISVETAAPALAGTVAVTGVVAESFPLEELPQPE